MMVYVVQEPDEPLDALLAALSRCAIVQDVSVTASAEAVAPGAPVAVVGAQDAKGAAAATSRLRGAGTAVIAIMRSPTPGQLISLFAADANAVLDERGAPSLIAVAIDSVCRGWLFVDPRLCRAVVRDAMSSRRQEGARGLTVQERRVLWQLPSGLSNSDIADEMAISVHTVKSHVQNLLRKLDAKNRVDAIRKAREHGLL